MDGSRSERAERRGGRCGQNAWQEPPVDVLGNESAECSVYQFQSDSSQRLQLATSSHYRAKLRWLGSMDWRQSKFGGPRPEWTAPIVQEICLEHSHKRSNYVWHCVSRFELVDARDQMACKKL